MSINVLLVDDHSIVRQGIAGLLSRAPNMKVVGEASDGATGIDLTRSLRPDVVVMDVGMPGMSGVEATRQIVADGDAPRILALSAFADRQHVLDVLRAGASGYVVKDCVVEELVEAIETVANGGRYISSAMASTVLTDLVSPSPNRSDTLTPRERDVLRLLADGKAMKEAALELQISTKTVETHRRAIMEKLQLFSVAELTKHAIREGYSTLE